MVLNPLCILKVPLVIFLLSIFRLQVTKPNYTMNKNSNVFTFWVYTSYIVASYYYDVELSSVAEQLIERTKWSLTNPISSTNWDNKFRTIWKQVNQSLVISWHNYGTPSWRSQWHIALETRFGAMWFACQGLWIIRHQLTKRIPDTFLFNPLCCRSSKNKYTCYYCNYCDAIHILYMDNI